MTHSQVQIYFYISLIIGMGLGLFLMIWWFRKIFKRLAPKNNETASINGTAFKTLIFGFPGILMFILCCIPALYFNSLIKKEAYCLDLIQFNKGIKKDDPDIVERCGCLDVDELFEKSKVIKQ